jgi:hypothetical protein
MEQNLKSMNQMSHDELRQTYYDKGLIIFPTKNNSTDKPKLPFIKNWQNLECSPIIKYNQKITGIGLLCGRSSGVTMIDYDKLKNTDIKNGLKDGLHYYNECCSHLRTPTVKTPNGIHQYFKYTNVLQNSVKSGKYSIDIRNDGGFGVIPQTPSYTFIHDFNTELMEIPQFLLDVILCEKEKKIVKNKIVKEKIVKEKNENTFFIIDNDAINKIDDALKTLKTTHCDDYLNWFKISTAIKHAYNESNDEFKIIIYNIWDEWSKSSANYNEENNKEIWQNIEPCVDINIIFNYAQIKHIIPKTKIIEHDIDTKLYTNIIEEINIKYNNIKNYDKYKTIFIKSGTGSGKSFASRQIIKKII